MTPNRGINKWVRVLFKDGSTYCGNATTIEVYADSKHEQRLILAAPGHLQWFPYRDIRRVFVGRV